MNKVLLAAFVLLFVSLFVQETFAQAQNENIRVEDDSFGSQDFRTGETFTIQGHLTVIIIEGLGSILIVLFIIIYAVKKRAKGVTHDKN